MRQERRLMSDAPSAERDQLLAMLRRRLDTTGVEAPVAEVAVRRWSCEATVI